MSADFAHKLCAFMHEPPGSGMRFEPHVDTHPGSAASLSRELDAIEARLARRRLRVLDVEAVIPRKEE